MKVFLLIFINVLLVSTLVAQKGRVTAEPVFIGPAPTVVKLPLPVYEQKTVRLNGIVSVAVNVNESGEVIVTDAGEGPYPICKNVTDPGVLSLRALAVAAAKNAKFAPAMVDSKPTTVNGRIEYNFDAGETAENPGLSSSGSPDARLDGLTRLGNTAVGSAALIVANGDTVSRGVLNGRAESLAKPVYPSAAKAVRAGGGVSVQVVIFEDGTVYSGAAVSGHPLLRRSSELAACSSRFSATLLEGKAYKVAGVITYNYVP